MGECFNIFQSLRILWKNLNLSYALRRKTALNRSSLFGLIRRMNNPNTNKF